MATDTEKLAKDLIAAVNSHDVDKMLTLFTDDCVYEDVAVGKVNRGKQELKTFVTGWYAFSNDIKFELTSQFSAGDWGATEWIMSGTHTGDVLGIPATNKRYSVRGASITELGMGRIRRNSDYWNLASFLQQIGILPATPTE
ncbi:MAG: ester cyclase [Chloroflexi bacterium]|nr:ester cyclase [Chloroflexota bacterium]